MKTLKLNYRNQNEMVQDGWTTQDLEDLKNTVRSKSAEVVDNHFHFPEVNGYKVLYSCFTQAEKKMYTDWRKSNNSGSGSTQTANSTAMSDETKALWDGLFAEIKDNPKAKAAFFKVCPLYSTDMPVFKLFNDFELPAEPVSAYWIMFQSASGRNENRKLTRAEAMTWACDDETVEQYLKKSDVEALVAQVPGAEALVKF